MATTAEVSARLRPETVVKDEPAADKSADGYGQMFMSSGHHAVSRLPESGDRATASRAGAMQVLTAANRNFREAGYDAVEILDAAMKFALDRLLQTVGRTQAVRYLGYVSEQIDGEAHSLCERGDLRDPLTVVTPRSICTASSREAVSLSDAAG